MPFIDLPFTTIDYIRFTYIEKRHVWSYLQAYIAEPNDSTKRKFFLVSIAGNNKIRRKRQIRKRLKKFPSSIRLERLKSYDVEKYKRYGGNKSLVHAFPPLEMERILQYNYRSLITVHDIVSVFLKLYVSDANSTSVSRAKRVIERYRADTRAYANKKDIERAWSRYKNVSHIIFALIDHDVCLVNGSGFSDKMVDILGVAVHCQTILTEYAVRNTKQPTLQPDEAILLPKLKGISPRPPVLTPLSSDQASVE